jgi:hypothetical protein
MIRNAEIGIVPFKSIKYSVIALLGMVGLLSNAVYVQAAGPTATVAVSASVKTSCRFQVTSGYTMTIANSGTEIDPALGTAATGTTNLTYRCTTGTSPEFQIGGSGGYSAAPTGVVVGLTGPAALNASFDLTSEGAGGGMSVDKTATLTGTISATDVEAATPGSYSKNVTVDIQVAP